MLGNILAVGLMSMGMGLSGVKDEPKMYAQDASTYTIIYESAEDWDSKAEDIRDWLIENSYTSASSYLTLTSAKISNFSTKTYVRMYYNSSNTRILLDVEAGNNSVNYNLSNNTWTGNTGDTFTLGTLTIVSQTYYEGNAEPEPNMGNDIVGTIASGLGIIGALATTFLTGFGNLFYSSGALTPFAIFALVMLGIAVSFAVVKLVLNLIRSNTGA